MDLQALRTELDTDPLTRGYAGMTDQQAADSLNTENRTVPKDSITGSEAFLQTDSTEYAALSDAKKSQWLALCGIAEHDPFGAAVDTVIDIFGGGSVTVNNLQTFRTNTVSRGVELGLGIVTTGDVQKARAL